MHKYSTKRTSNNNSFEHYSKHRRDYSPSRNRRSHSRNSSPESWSPRGSSKYSRSRDRESKYYDGHSKNKYARSSRSPIGHESSRSYKSSSGVSRNHYENSHNYSSSHSSKKIVGDWSEIISSSGRRYYYNEKTSVSQWEKPKEVLDWEKRHSSSSSKYSSSSEKHSNHRDKYDADFSNPKAYSNELSSNSSREKSKDYFNSQHPSPMRHHHSSSRVKENCDDKTRDEKRPQNDFDICSNGNSKKKELINCNNNHHSYDKTETNKTQNSPGKLSTNESTNATSSSSIQSDQNLFSILSALTSLLVQPNTLASLNLTKLFTQLHSSYGINLSNLPQEETLNFLKKALLLTQKSQNNQINQNTRQTSSNSPRYSNSYQANHSPTKREEHSNKNTNNRHFNNSDKIRQDLDQLTKSFNQASECKSSSNCSENNSILSSINSNVLNKTPAPNLSKFKHLFKEDLVSHVTGWNSEQYEKQISSMIDQANSIGNHLCTRVSTDLKTSRSLVRLTEIQTTLQKQRILFISQQMKTVEEWKQPTNYS